MTKAKRKPLSKKTRFEVFKRDKFTCQYCGRQAPDVILEVDHINPVANGGTNDIVNLVTSCHDCNSGKGAKLLSDDVTIKKEKAELDLLAERREQLDMMREWKNELLETEDNEVEIVNELIESLTTQHLTIYGVSRCKALIRKYGLRDTLIATNIAFTKYEVEDAFEKLGGILYNMHNKTCQQCVEYAWKKENALCICNLDAQPHDKAFAERCPNYESRYRRKMGSAE